MNREQAVKLCHNVRSTKQELREALAFALGIEAPQTAKTDTKNVFNECREFFLYDYARQTGLSYYWTGADAAALKQLLMKIQQLDNGNGERVFDLFVHLVSKLPEWYRTHAFTLPVINSKFNNIVRMIKNQSNGNHISTEYRNRLLNDLLAE